MANLWHRLKTFWGTKAKVSPVPLRFFGSSTEGPLDRFRRQRPPSLQDLMGELKNTAYTCATLNASTCAAYPPRLYVTTREGQAQPKCRTASIRPERAEWFRSRAELDIATKGAVQIEEVLDHPLLTLFRSVNEEHNAWDLWELTTLYQETAGTAYWLVEKNALGVPSRLWIVPPHQIVACNANDQSGILYYEYRNGKTTQRLAPEDVIAFKYPDPQNPYGPGRSPLRSCWEHVLFDGEYLSLKRSKINNSTLPGVILSPDEVVGEDEARRLTAEWNAKMLQGGQGSALVTESRFHVQLLNQSLGDYAALAESGVSREIVANAFGVPAPYLFRETNLANMQAAEMFHLSHTIRPRLMRRDEKLNERLIPMFDPSGRLFVASDDPRPSNRDRQVRETAVYTAQGIKTINEARADLGLKPVSWGDIPPWERRGPDGGHVPGDGDGDGIPNEASIPQ